jgi:hypothetical protein
MGSVVFVDAASTFINSRMRAIRLGSTQALGQSRESQKPQHRYLWRGIKWMVATVIAVVALLAVGDQFRGWPADPEIHPLGFPSGTPPRQLFSIRNRTMFKVDMELTCGVDLIVAKDANGQLVEVADFAFINGTFSIPPFDQPPINYTCDASSLVEVQPDGSPSFSQSLSAKPSKFRAPLSIVKMCLWIGGKYALLYRNWTFRSMIFKWSSLQNAPHWVEGPIAQEPPPSHPKGIDALECSSSVRFPYILLAEPGKPPTLIRN